MGDAFVRAEVAEESSAVELRILEIVVYGTMIDELDAGVSGQLLLIGDTRHATSDTVLQTV